MAETLDPDLIGVVVAAVCVGVLAIVIISLMTYCCFRKGSEYEKNSMLGRRDSRGSASTSIALRLAPTMMPAVSAVPVYSVPAEPVIYPLPPRGYYLGAYKPKFVDVDRVHYVHHEREMLDGDPTRSPSLRLESAAQPNGHVVHDFTSSSSNYRDKRKMSEAGVMGPYQKKDNTKKKKKKEKLIEKGSKDRKSKNGKTEKTYDSEDEKKIRKKKKLESNVKKKDSGKKRKHKREGKDKHKRKKQKALDASSSSETSSSSDSETSDSDNASDARAKKTTSDTGRIPALPDAERKHSDSDRREPIPSTDRRSVSVQGATDDRSCHPHQLFYIRATLKGSHHPEHSSH